MAHVFVAPHPDDVALSCGGLIASLRELGQNVTIITAFSGSGGANGATGTTPTDQREALGFGNKTLWPDTEAFNRSDIRADVPGLADAVDLDADGSPVATLPPWAATDDRLEATQEDADQSAKRFWQRASWYRRASIRNRPLAGQMLIDTLPTQGAIYTDDVVDAAAAGQSVAKRRVEDERYAYFAEASIIFLDLPDAVYRGYEGDDELLGAVREDDLSVVETLRREIVRLEPQNVYFPLAVGNHVDHQLCRDAGVALLAQPRDWVMPGPRWAGNVVFYEDFPYSWWSSFDSLASLPQGALAGIPSAVALTPRYADISEQLERKIQGLLLYESQLDRLFGGAKPMAATVRQAAARLATLGGHGGAAERYWHSYLP